MSDNYFTELNQINVNDNTEKKGQFTYLSWSYAWGELKKKHPDATYKVRKFGEDNKPYLFDESLGYMVFTEVTVNDLTHEMWLPVMNFRNQAVQKGQATMMDINKAIMRCLVKNIGMHGIGLYIYAGEDMPNENDGVRNDVAKQKKTPKVSSPKGTYQDHGVEDKVLEQAVTKANNYEIKKIRELYKPDEIKTMLTRLKLKDITDLSKDQAKQMIAARPNEVINIEKI